MKNKSVLDEIVGIFFYTKDCISSIIVKESADFHEIVKRHIHNPVPGVEFVCSTDKDSFAKLYYQKMDGKRLCQTNHFLT